MNRVLRSMVAAGALSLLALGGTGPLASAGDSDGRTTIGVRNGASEFSFYLSRVKVAPGPAFVQYQNSAEDPHDLKMQRVGTATEYATGEVLPGDTAAFTVSKLKAGSTYRLWCSFDGHVDAGMEAFVKVKRKRRG